VGFTSSRDEFVTVGTAAAATLIESLQRNHPVPVSPETWLDFGCGCGRVARYLLGSARIGSVCGVDVDPVHIRWLQDHLPGEWHRIPPKPPTSLESGRFDVIAAVSVFTHLDEPDQDEWLAELARLLRPGGFLLATTHGFGLTKACLGIRPEDLGRLDSTGYLFVPAPGAVFSDQAAFHTEAYLRQHWNERLLLVDWRPNALLGYQDLGVWKRLA
jgi:SAM-dependent methyltransferase